MAYKLIEGGGVTTPKGFLAGACYVGVKSRKSEKPDVAIIYSEQPASCAAMFTTNKFCAAPVILDREILKKGKARAVVINSGNANAATGEQGIKDAKTVETEAEKLLGLGEDEGVRVLHRRHRPEAPRGEGAGGRAPHRPRHERGEGHRRSLGHHDHRPGEEGSGL